jgi:hypothetical protein
LAQELILNIDSDTHTSEDEDNSPPQGDSEIKGEERTQTGYTQWITTAQF